jgi:hypothetical protein
VFHFVSLFFAFSSEFFLLFHSPSFLFSCFHQSFKACFFHPYFADGLLSSFIS